MKPAPFIRHAPKTLDEALKILAEVAPQDGRVLAGGQSLVPIMAFRLAKPAHLVDINEVAGLDKIASDGRTLSIGACVRHAAFHKSVTGNPLGKLLNVVARHIAHYPIRMRGTFCGSLAHAGNRFMKRRMPYARANRQCLSITCDLVEARDLVDAHEMRGLREPERHDRNETLPTGQHAAVLRRYFGQDLERLIEGFRRMADKRRRLH